uniref:Uncharacterized protein n=1 Tax=Clandestinovirus TaxID=2831644 RepID=A0A8F8KP71_9VIRU|nr:hypothetical protein KOM_12_478 [Clandestinovirus]
MPQTVPAKKVVSTTKSSVTKATTSTAKTKRTFMVVTPFVVQKKVQPQKFHLTKVRYEEKDPGDAARKEANRRYRSDKSTEPQKVYKLYARVYIYDRARASIRVYKIVDQQILTKELRINDRSTHQKKILQTTMKFEGQYPIDRQRMNDPKRGNDVIYTGPMKHNVRKGGAAKISAKNSCKSGPCKNSIGSKVKVEVKSNTNQVAKKPVTNQVRIKSEPK